MSVEICLSDAQREEIGPQRRSLPFSRHFTCYCWCWLALPALLSFLAGILPATVWAGEPNEHFFPTRRGEYAIRYNKSNKGEGDGCS